jgi:hypothetical protein
MFYIDKFIFKNKKHLFLYNIFNIDNIAKYFFNACLFLLLFDLIRNNNLFYILKLNILIYFYLLFFLFSTFSYH